MTRTDFITGLDFPQTLTPSNINPALELDHANIIAIDVREFQHVYSRQ